MLAADGAVMRELQERVQVFVDRHGLEAGVEARALDLAAEVGEVAKEVLKVNRYGRSAFVSSPAFAEELGDVLFSLICLANEAGVDLGDSLGRVLAKYEERIGLRGSPGSSVE